MVTQVCCLVILVTATLFIIGFSRSAGNGLLIRGSHSFGGIVNTRTRVRTRTRVYSSTSRYMSRDVGTRAQVKYTTTYSSTYSILQYCNAHVCVKYMYVHTSTCIVYRSWKNGSSTSDAIVAKSAYLKFGDDSSPVKTPARFASIHQTEIL